VAKNKRRQFNFINVFNIVPYHVRPGAFGISRYYRPFLQLAIQLVLWKTPSQKKHSEASKLFTGRGKNSTK